MSTLDDPIYNAQKPASKWPLALRWGLIGGLAGIALQMLWQVMGWSDYSNNMSAGNLALMPLGWIIGIGATALGIKQYRDEHNGGFISFSSGFGMGMMIALVMAVLGTIFVVAYMGDVMQEAMSSSMQERFESQGLDDEQIEEATKMAGMFTSTPMLAVFGMLGGLVSGLIYSLIASAIMKRDAPSTYSN